MTHRDTHCRGACISAAFVAGFLTCTIAVAQTARDPASLVDPFVGTLPSPLGEPGNTYPGATRPFGMLDWGPDQAKGRYYRFNSASTRGFSLTHMSGPGCPAFGDAPILPLLGAPDKAPPAQAEPYQGEYDPNDQTAEPGYYGVKLASGIQVRLAAAVHSGISEIRFPAGGGDHTVLLDLGRNLTHVTDSDVHVQDRTITGSVASGKFCNKRNEYRLYFFLQFDRTPTKQGTFNGPQSIAGNGSQKGPSTGAYVSFPQDVEAVRMRVGLSYVSVANAELNLKQEIPDWNFEKQRREAHDAWNKMLALIQVKGGAEQQQRVFYTDLYHALIHPSTFSDVNGEYLGFDDQVHNAKPRTQYANFSGWDIYRCQVQLITMLMPRVGSDMAQSLVVDAEQGGGLPRWSVANNEAGSMVGDPADLILASIYAFGGKDFDAQSALRAMLRGANDPQTHARWSPERPRLDDYLQYGFVPQGSDKSGTASITLEFTSADFAISRLAKALGDQADARKFLIRSANWRNVFDPETRYVRPRDAARNFLPDFDAGKETGFVEGNSAQYTWMVPYDLSGLIAAIGGPEEANSRLDKYFSQYGHYHGGPYFRIANEPSFACPWIYNWTGRPDRAQEVVRKTLTDLFTDAHGGLPGNDDLGATSAWAVFAQLGIYPEIPAVGGFTLNSPVFPEVQLRAGTREVHIQAKGAPESIYIQRVTLDGKAIDNYWIPWEQFSKAKRLEFTLSHRPNKTPGATPPSFEP